MSYCALEVPAEMAQPISKNSLIRYRLYTEQLKSV